VQEAVFLLCFIQHVCVSLAGCYSQYYIKNSYCDKLVILTFSPVLLVSE